MAIKPIVEIELPTDKLKAFIETYNAFKEALGKQPDEWAAAGASIANAIEPLTKMVQAAEQLGDASAAASVKAQAAAEVAARQAQIDETRLQLLVKQRETLVQRTARQEVEAQRKSERDAQQAVQREATQKITAQRRVEQEALKLKKEQAEQKKQEDKRREEVLEGFGARARLVGQDFGNMAKSTTDIVTNVKSATLDFLKWTGIITAFTGLVGAGGLFGIDRMAAGVLDQSRQARDLGVTMGEQNAFRINYSPYLDDPSGTLGKFADAKSDLNKGQRIFGELGLSNWRQQDPSQLAAAAAIAIKQQLGNGPLTQQRADALGWTTLFNMGELRNIQSTPLAQLQAAQSQFGKDSRDLNVSDPVQKAWTALSQQLDRAGSKIKEIFITDLSRLAGPIGDLSSDLVGLLATLLNLPEVQQGLSTFTGWVKDLDAYLKSSQFQKDLTTWESDFKATLKAIGDAFQSFEKLLEPGGIRGHWTGIPLLSTYKAADPKQQSKVPFWADPTIGNLLGTTQGHDSIERSVKKGVEEGLSGGGAFGGLGGAYYQNQAYRLQQGLSARLPIVQADYQVGGQSAYAPQSGYAPQGDFNASQFGTLEAANGLPAGLLTRVRQAESGGNDLAVSPTGAQGPFQFEPGTAARYGVQNPFDLGQSASGAARYLRDLLQEFHDNLAQALAGYNWGQGNVEKDIKKYGNDWFTHTPAATQAYVGQIMGGNVGGGSGEASRGAPAPIMARIRVENRTGGSAIISLATVAA